MGKCTHHPDRETRFQCLKHNVWLCEECLQCRDPELYCKNRSACPIWFIEKRQKRREKEQAAAEAMPRFRVTFEPDARAVELPAGATLLEAAQAADIHLNASCNGKGLCGKCKLVGGIGKNRERADDAAQRRRKGKTLCAGLPEPSGRRCRGPHSCGGH